MFIDKHMTMRKESVFPCGVVVLIFLFHLVYGVTDERRSAVCQLE